MKPNLEKNLWSSRRSIWYLMLGTVCIIFSFLGAHDIWTQEHRWADIVSGMFMRHDFLHPYLGSENYYDKPLLSYWLISFFAKLTGQLNTWALRLPSALSGVLAIWSIYRIGAVVRNKELGVLSGWLFLTTFYFVFWARTSSADMLNLAGSLFAICWYMEHRTQTGFFAYAVFFLVVALTSLCKGLVGAIVPLLVVFIDMCLQRSLRNHINWRLFLAILPALLVYVVPFWASSVLGGEGYQENGLYLVYRENILRYFQPFDHKDPIYTYFIYLPVYLFPWTILFIPALWTCKKRWADMPLNSKWVGLSTIALFIFFTLSGSRRSYYVLPIVPFAILFTADWILTRDFSAPRLLMHIPKWIALVFILLFVNFCLVLPFYYTHGQLQRFVPLLKAQADHIRPWSSWNKVFLDSESKLNFYLHIPPDTEIWKIKGKQRNAQTPQTLLAHWPMLKNPDANTIYISRKQYAEFLHRMLPNHRMVAVAPNKLELLLHKESGAPVAFIPNNS